MIPADPRTSRRENWRLLRAVILLPAIFLAPFFTFSRIVATHFDTVQAQQLTETFHERLARGDADSIYLDADSEFQQKVPLERHRLYITQAVARFGTPGACDRSITSVKWDMGGKRIMLQCFSVFSRGAAEEVFVWRKRDGQYHLYAFSIKDID